MAFTKGCLDAYKPHWVEGTKVIAVFAIPFGLLDAVSGFIPLLGAVLSIVAGLGYLLVLLFFGIGAQAEFSLRLAAGAPTSSALAWQVQARRMFPWTFALFVPALISGLGCIVTYILFGLLMLPAFMIEDRRMFAANQRSLELSSKDWALAIVPVLLVAVPAVLVEVLVTVVLGFVPKLGPILIALWVPLFTSVFYPLLSFIQFRTYFALRLRHEGVDATAFVRQRAQQA